MGESYHVVKFRIMEQNKVQDIDFGAVIDQSPHNSFMLNEKSDVERRETCNEIVSIDQRRNVILKQKPNCLKVSHQNCVMQNLTKN
jgi:hypothetical protein